MNVVDKFKTSDGKPTINGKTTLNLSPAIARSYEWARDFGDDVVLEIPPAKRYGVDAYSVDEYITLALGEDNNWNLTLRGCGRESPIIPLRSSNLAEKLILSGGGPRTMSSLLTLENLFYVGDSTLVNNELVTDCYSLIRTDTDIGVVMRNVRAYGLRACGPNGLFDLKSMHLRVQNSYLHGCGHEDPTKALISIMSGVFGILFEHVHTYPSEHRALIGGQLDFCDPFGGPAFRKDQVSPCYDVRLLGDAAVNAPIAQFVQCTSGGYSLGFLLVDPAPDGQGHLHVQAAQLTGCKIMNGCQRTVKAVRNLERIIIDGNTVIRHNDASVPTIEMCDSSVKDLSVFQSAILNGLDVDASNGQRSVRVIQSHGGNYDVTGASFVEFDPSSTYDSLVGP